MLVEGLLARGAGLGVLSLIATRTGSRPIGRKLNAAGKH